MNDFTLPDGTKVHLIGDPHLGRKFEVGVPMHRRGEREAKQLQHFKEELAVEADVIIMVGDLFDHPYVGYAVVQDASRAIYAAAMAQPDTQYIMMAGNHDLPRNINNVGAFDDLEERVAGRLGNLDIVRSPQVFGGIAVFPWEWDRRADAQVDDLRQRRNVQAAVGHWDLSTFNGRDDHLAPVAAIRKAFGEDIPIWSGHYHKAGRYGEVECTGSLEPYTHAEDDTGHYYVTLSLAEALSRDDLTDKNVRLILKPGEDVPALDSASLTYTRTTPVDEGETPTVDLKTFDWEAILAQKLAPLDKRVQVFINERLATNAGESEE